MNTSTENKQEKVGQSKKEGWLKPFLVKTAVVAASAAVGYAAGYATKKLLTK